MFRCDNSSLILKKERWLSWFENRVVRKIFGSKSQEVTGEWRKQHNEEFSDLHISPILQATNSRRNLRGSQSTYWQRRDVYGVLRGILREGDHLDYTELHKSIIFTRNLKQQQQGICWIEVALNMDRFTGTCECCTETLYSIYCSECLDQQKVFTFS